MGLPTRTRGPPVCVAAMTFLLPRCIRIAGAVQIHQQSESTFNGSTAFGLGVALYNLPTTEIAWPQSEARFRIKE